MRKIAALLVALLLAAPAYAQTVTSAGNVQGAASSTDGHCALFNGSSGKSLKDGGACPGGGGGSLTVTDGTNSVTSTTTITTGNCIVVGGSAGSATVTPTTVDATKSADYTVAAGDMCGVLNLSGAHTLTIPAISSTVFASGMSLCVSDIGTGNWAVSSTPTLNGFSGTTLYPGSAGCFVSNGTSLDFQPGTQAPTTTRLGGVLALGAVSHNFLTSISTAGAPAAAQPAFTDISGTAQVAQGGTGVTSAQGNGTKVQLSTGTTTTNDCVKYDANGNTVDAGSACGGAGTGCIPAGSAGQVLVDSGSGTCTSRPYTSPSTVAVHQVLVATATSTLTAKTVPDCVDTSGNHLNYTQSTDAFSCGTSSSGGSGGLTHPGYVSGQYYGPIFSSTGTLTATANRIYVVPFLSGPAKTFTKISLNVVNNLAGNCELGVYNNSNGQPSTLVTDGGHVSVASTGTQELTGLTIALSAYTVYWLGVGCDSTPGLLAASNSDHSMDWLQGGAAFGFNSQMYGAWTYSANNLPSTFPTVVYNGGAFQALVELRF